MVIRGSGCSLTPILSRAALWLGGRWWSGRQGQMAEAKASYLSYWVLATEVAPLSLAHLVLRGCRDSTEELSRS